MPPPKYHLIMENGYFLIISSKIFIGDRSKIKFSGDLNLVRVIREQLLAKSHVLVKSCEIGTIINNEENETYDELPADDDEEEPYPPSEEEYIPSDQSSEEETETSSTRIRLNPNFKKNLFGTTKDCVDMYAPESDSSSLSEAFSTKSTSTASTSKSKQITSVIIKQSEVTLEVAGILHKGAYSFAVIPVSDHLTGFIVAQNLDRHICLKKTEFDTVACVLTRSENDRTFQCTANYCVPAGRFNGREIWLTSSQLHFTPLLPAVKEDFDLVPSLNVKKTKLKYNYCKYCKKLRTCIGRHFITMHKSESQVTEIIALPARSSERAALLHKLRLECNNIYNDKCDPHKRLPLRRPKSTSVGKFITCLTCRGLIAPRNFARHERQCSGRRSNRVHVAREAKRHHMLSHSTSDTETLLLNRLLSSLVFDEISEVVRSDETIKMMGLHKAVFHKTLEYHNVNTRQLMRRAARLLMEMRLLDAEIIQFKDCLKPQKYMIVIEAIYNMCLLDKKEFTFQKPAIAYQLNSLLKLAVEVRRVHYEKQGYLGDSFEILQLNSFLSVHQCEFAKYVSRSANTNIIFNKFNKDKELPTMSDVKIFNEYIKTQSETSEHDLNTNGFSYHHWLNLMKAILLQLLLFNRRRVGDVSKALISNFEKLQTVPEEELSQMSRLEAILARTFKRMDIIAKRCRCVPLLMTENQRRCLNLVLSLRNDAGVKEDNPYLFGVPYLRKYLDASAVLAEFALRSGAEHPKRLRGTKMRKQVATLSQMLNLSDNDMQQIADFMGHSLEVHKQYYRQPDINLQTTKLASFFMAAAGSDMNQYRGKTLEELETLLPEINIRDAPNDSSDESENEGLPAASTVPHIDIPSTSGLSSNTTQEMANFSQNEESGPEHPNQKILTTPQRKKNSRRVTSRGTPSKRQSIAEILYEVRTTPKKRRRTKKQTWSERQRAIMFEEFAECLRHFKEPTLHKCRSVLNMYKEELGNRSERALYQWVQYRNRKNKGLAV